MTARSPLRLLTAVLLLSGSLAVLGLGTTLVRHVAAGPQAGFALFAWAVGFAVLLPVGLTVVAVLPAALGLRRVRRVVPNAGWNIPRTGQ
ncbi:hypothetical protein [Lysobacter xanthus]